MLRPQQRNSPYAHKHSAQTVLYKVLSSCEAEMRYSVLQVGEGSPSNHIPSSDFQAHMCRIAKV